jgi:hypothetical protein
MEILALIFVSQAEHQSKSLQGRDLSPHFRVRGSGESKNYRGAAVKFSYSAGAETLDLSSLSPTPGPSESPDIG